MRLRFAVAAATLAYVGAASLRAGDFVFTTTKVCQVTGTQDRQPPGKPTGAELSGVTGGVTGTDLGFPFEYDGKLHFLFGDSREFPPDLCEPLWCGTEAEPIDVLQPNPEKVQRWQTQAEWDTFVALRGDGLDSMATAPLEFDPDRCVAVRFETNDFGLAFVHDLAGNDVGIPSQLAGPPVAGRPEDKWVLAMGNRILVVTVDGRVFVHDVTGNTIGVPFQLSGPRVAARPEDKWVLAMGTRILVVTADGRVFVHDVTGNRIGVPFQLGGPKVAARPEDKWVLAAGSRILVITADGRVFVHDVTANTIGVPFRLGGPRVAANSRDKRVLAVGNRILVLTGQDGIFRPTRLNGNVLGRKEGAIGAFANGQTLYAFFTQRSRPPGCKQREGCAHDDEQPGGKTVLARSADGGRSFDETRVVSDTNFLWAVPAVDQSAHAPGLPADLTGQVLFVWGTGRENNDKEMGTVPWNHSYPFLAVAPVSSVESKDGRVFTHELSGDTIGVPFQLGGPKVAANPEDKWVLVMGNRILVVTKDGRVFVHDVTGNTIEVPFQLSGPKVAANPEDKWVLVMGSRILVVTTDGRVFVHDVTGNTIGVSFQLSGPMVAARPEDKEVLVMGNRILVLTADGRVFVHEVIGNTIGLPFQLGGPTVATRPEDKRVLVMGNRILVLTADGRAFAHDVTGSTIGVPFQLAGPMVGARPEDKWVLAMAAANRILIVTKQLWRYYAGAAANGLPGWTEDEALAQPLPPFGPQRGGKGFHECLGYFSVRFIEALRQWVMLYTCADDESAGYNKNNGPRGIYLRSADLPWGPWSPPQRIFDPDTAYCFFMHHQIVTADDDFCRIRGGANPAEESVRDTRTKVTKRGWGGEYAPFLLPSRYVKSDGNAVTLYFFMSTWNPYQVVLMRTQATPKARAPSDRLPPGTLPVCSR